MSSILVVAASNPGPVARLVAAGLGIYGLLIFAVIILSWFPMRPDGGLAQIHRTLRRATDPVLSPVRRAMPSTGPLDLSPLVVLLAISFLRQLILG